MNNQKEIFPKPPKLSPEQALLVAIIKSADLERDLRYFESDTFKAHCSLLKLSSSYVKKQLMSEW